jgi:hypothetical protein
VEAIVIFWLLELLAPSVYAFRAEAPAFVQELAAPSQTSVRLFWELLAPSGVSLLPKVVALESTPFWWFSAFALSASRGFSGGCRGEVEVLAGRAAAVTLKGSVFCRFSRGRLRVVLVLVVVWGGECLLFLDQSIE